MIGCTPPPPPLSLSISISDLATHLTPHPPLAKKKKKKKEKDYIKKAGLVGAASDVVATKNQWFAYSMPMYTCIDIMVLQRSALLIHANMLKPLPPHPQPALSKEVAVVGMRFESEVQDSRIFD